MMSYHPTKWTHFGKEVEEEEEEEEEDEEEEEEDGDGVEETKGHQQAVSLVWLATSRFYLFVRVGRKVLGQRREKVQWRQRYAVTACSVTNVTFREEKLVLGVLERRYR